LRTAVLGRDVKRTFLRAILWAVVCIIGFKVSVVHVRVLGISMLPTYPEKSTHWVGRLAYVWHEPRRGDIIAIRCNPEDSRNPVIASLKAPPQALLLKRVVGLPGETVSFSGGHLLIDGVPVEEPYETLPCDWTRSPEKLAADQYFVVGDNRNMPQENHYFGRCARSQIVGKVLL